MIFSWILSVPIIGFCAGLVTERLSVQNFAPNLMGSLTWNTTVKVTSATVSWLYFIHSEANVLCLLASVTLLSRDSSCMEEVEDFVGPLFRVFLKSSIFCFAARLGIALQPVGLTGGIATGKSTVSSILQRNTRRLKNAFIVIDVDSIAHDVLEPGKMGEDCGYKQVVDAFTECDILEKSGSSITHPLIDRRKLGDVIFRDPLKRRMLNKITHPLISKIMMKKIIKEGCSFSSSKSSVVAVDIPLLFEIGLKMRILFGIKVVVACSPDVQLRRLMNRNKDLTNTQCEERISSQIPVAEKVQRADIIINNNGTLKDLEIEVERARDEIISRKQGLLGISLVKIITTLNAVTALLYAFYLVKKTSY